MVAPWRSCRPMQRIHPVVVRSLLRQRMLSGQNVNLPFHLIERKDGRYSLVDPRRARAWSWMGSGPTNSDAFARLYRAGRGEP